MEIEKVIGQLDSLPEKWCIKVKVFDYNCLPLSVYKNLDKLIVVTASMDNRIQRVMNRDDISEEQVKARINAQLPESEKLKVADFVINNDNR